MLTDIQRDEAVKNVQAYIRDHHAAIHHPLIRMILDGSLTREQLCGWAREFWVISQTHLVNNAGKLAHAQMLRGGLLSQITESPYDHDIVALLGESVMDEMGHTEISPASHYDIYLNLTDALNLDRDSLADTTTLMPHSLAAMYIWTTTSLNFSLLELLSSHNLVNDTVNPTVYPPLCEALTKHYGLSKSAIAWYDLHGEVDIEHGSRSVEIIKKLLQEEADVRTMKTAAQLGLSLKWIIYDGVMRGYVDQTYKH